MLSAQVNTFHDMMMNISFCFHLGTLLWTKLWQNSHWLPYSTYLYLDFHLLCSMTKLKEHSREICWQNSRKLIFNKDGYHISRNEIWNYWLNQLVVIDSIRPEFSKFLKICSQHMNHIAPKSTCSDWLHKTRAFRSSWTCYHLAILF